MKDSEFFPTVRDLINNDDDEKIRSLMERSPEMLDRMTSFGTCLHLAATKGSMKVVHALISMGADINAKGGTFGGGPINLAANYGQFQAVQVLLAAGAELDVTEPERNPLFSAIQEGSLEIVKLLVEHGIDYRVSYTGEFMKNMDAVAFAREQGQIEIANYLTKLKSRAN